MTARRPDAIGAHPQRRLAWARRENERRRQAYETAARTWRRRADHLDRLSMEAAGFRGCPLPGTALPVPLDDGEVVYRILPTVDLVEATARHLPGLPVPGRALAGCLDPADGPLPAGLRVVGSGAAVVTDRRVAFAGPDARRDWPLRDVRGLGHHPDRPVTLLHDADGGAPAGLRMPAPGAANARFYLTLAHADATGTREACVEDVEALRSAHRAARPRPPRPLGPWDAPADRALPSGWPRRASRRWPCCWASPPPAPGRRQPSRPIRRTDRRPRPPPRPHRPHLGCRPWRPRSTRRRRRSGRPGPRRRRSARMRPPNPGRGSSPPHRPSPGRRRPASATTRRRPSNRPALPPTR
ncbi:hypothetical protein V2I01_39230 [Micromonospora sp. BRA006-A]|nr:hypothetical protein [Micromonospora sp. BRA006-A]